MITQAKAQPDAQPSEMTAEELVVSGVASEDYLAELLQLASDVLLDKQHAKELAEDSLYNPIQPDK